MKTRMRDEGIKNGFIVPPKENVFKKFIKPIFQEDYEDDSVKDDIVKPAAKNPYF